MFVDAAAIVAVLCDEPEAERCSRAIADSDRPITAPLAVWEAVIAICRPDKLAIDLATGERLVRAFLANCQVALVEMPADTAVELSLEAARRYRNAKSGRLNLADCFHYACAQHHGVPILSTGDEFRFTDIATVP